jgi:CHAT domain-containing protein
MSRADTFLATGNEAKAAKSYDQSLRIARKIGLQEVIWRTLYGLGRLNRAAQRFSLAAKNFQESIKIIESMRAAIKVEEFRNGFLSDKMDVYEALIFLLLKQGKIGAAYDFSERARARSFIDLLGNQRISLKSAASTELLALFRTEQNRLYQLRQAWAASSPAKRTTLHAAVKAQAQKVQEILADIKSNDPQLSTFVNVEPLSLSQVQALLAPEVKLLEYFVGKHATVVWGLSRDQLAVRIVPITRDELSAKVQTYRDLLSNLQPVEAITRSLYELLLQPIASFFTPSRYLGIIPHGVLHYIPFAAFHNGEQFLVDNHAIFYAPSASVLRFTFNKRKNGRHLKAVLAIGNPDLGELNYDLPLAEKEVESLQWSFPDITILTRDKALESWVVQNIEKYGIVHIASHGEFDPINPLFSALKLARDFQADGNLEVGEIFGLNVQADLVTLSACQTGLGTLLNGDELIGLNRAFLYAGTHALIASLWRIDDLASAVLMKHFYRFYQGHTKAEALRQAQLTVRQQFPHPAHWAGFVLSGDYQ